MEEVESEKDGYTWKRLAISCIKFLIPFLLGGLTIEISRGDTKISIKLMERVAELERSVHRYNPKDPVLASPLLPVPALPDKGPKLEENHK